MKSLIKICGIVALSFNIVSCGSKPEEKPIAKKIIPYDSTVLANQVLRNPRITLLRKQVSGRVDGASAYHNIAAAARGASAKRSSYGRAPGGYVRLNRSMLSTMLYLANARGYSYRITSIAGGSHSRTSRHYAGVAFDIDMINGRKVGYNNPYYRTFMNIGRARGATEVLGPGDRAHSTHVHLAWPR